MSIKIIGTNQGQRGDLIMGTVVAKAIKERFPESHFTLGINEKYQDMEDLFKNHPYIDATHIWEQYDNWPNQNDINYIENNNFNMILHAMPKHPNDHCWYNLVKHQTEASCIMNGLTPPKDLNCILNKYFDLYSEYKNYICIAPFTAWQKKNISLIKWEDIVSFITKKGFRVAQLGSEDEITIKGAEKINASYFESVKIMLSCRFLICLDGGMSWVASAYQHPVLGLYGYHYDNLLSAKVYEPLNPNAIYLESDKADNIYNYLIFDNLNKLLYN
jgi:ADP-heptose:LPS heptosyltransferase